LAATFVMAVWIIGPLWATGHRLAKIYRPIEWQQQPGLSEPSVVETP
jgi:hypothetical protein